MTKSYGDIKIIGKLDDVFQDIEKVAPANTTVLIQGETGTGKELVARAIHYESKRDGRLVTVNCAAIPENLLESELFGHVKGAFTSAYYDKKGKFEDASGGTIFLDEIGDMPPGLQVKLLKVLEDGEFERVGENRVRSTDARVIAATNRNLEEMLKNGTFREDLYYRIYVVPISLPPLRERIGDVPELISYSINKYYDHIRGCSSGNKSPEMPNIHMEGQALSLMLKYSWPGNIRELENAIQFALTFFDGHKIMKDDLPKSISGLKAEPSTELFYSGIATYMLANEINIKYLVSGVTAAIKEAYPATEKILGEK